MAGLCQLRQTPFQTTQIGAAGLGIVGVVLLVTTALDALGGLGLATGGAVAVAGWQLAKQRDAVASGAAPALAETKPVSVGFFLSQIVPEAAGLKASAMAGSELLYSLSAEALVG